MTLYGATSQHILSYYSNLGYNNNLAVSVVVHQGRTVHRVEGLSQCLCAQLWGGAHVQSDQLIAPLIVDDGGMRPKLHYSRRRFPLRVQEGSKAAAAAASVVKIRL